MERSKNLDWLAARYAQEIISRTKKNGRKPQEVDNLVTKALGVLQEEGIYACGLYLLSRTRDEEKKISPVIKEEALGLLKELSKKLSSGWGSPESDDAEGTLKYLSEKVVGDPKLERLLLAKETLEQMMIYARYGAKAWKEEPKESQQAERE